MTTLVALDVGGTTMKGALARPAELSERGASLLAAEGAA
jgi:hypothetical protein